MQTEIIRVTKAFTFDMAHALYGYEGPCKNIHGHTYTLEVTVLGSPEAAVYGKSAGMVVDFGVLKSIVHELIIKSYDHALVLNVHIPASLRACAFALTEKVIFTPFQPTCENLLLSIKNDLKPALEAKGLSLFSVKLFETPTSWAAWYVRDAAD